MPSRLTLAACLCLVAAAGAPAQTPAPSTPAAAPADPPRPTSIDDLPANLRVSLRAEFVRRRLPVAPAVVVVPDAASYVAAVGSWRTGVRFPVLIDDGAWPARQAVARFVRAFAPERVVRWSAGDKAAWPADEAEQRALVEAAAARAWDAPEAATLIDQWKKLRMTPPGVVLASASDPAWTGALALAAGRGQPIAWVTPPDAGGLDGMMTLEQADELGKAAAAACAATGLRWDAIGDDLDAVTLCLNCPAKIFLGQSDKRLMLAVTDVIGRSAEGARAARWAWCGQVAGGEAEAAYAAMSALFLRPGAGEAWLFDGYDEGPPWNGWDATAAAVVLEKAGIKTVVDDGGGRGAADWSRRAAGRVRRNADDRDAGMGVRASFVAVMTSGNEDFFDLKPGKMRAPDVPVLEVPAAVYFVHSWSANKPGNPGTIGGRWLERGAYAYLGSVHEPYLQAFVKTPAVAQRLIGGMAWGVATRMDEGEPWKIAVFGDPLMTYGAGQAAAGTRVKPDLQIAGATDVQDELAAALKERDYATALGALSTLGRDRDAARLLAAVIKSEPERLTESVALAGLGAAYFTGDLDSFLKAYRAALPVLSDESAVSERGLRDARDMLWHALWPRLATLGASEGELLAASLRPETLVRDATDAYLVATRTKGKRDADEVLVRAKSLTQDAGVRAEIDAIGR